MSMQKKTKVSDQLVTINEEQVNKYLQDNPDFLTHYPQLMDTLVIPHHQPGTSSLIERQAKLLRESNQSLKQRLAQLINNAQANEQLFNKTRDIIISIIKASSLQILHETVCKNLQEQFAIDFVRFTLFSDKELNIPTTTWQHAEPHLKHLVKEKVTCGFLRETELDFIFQDAKKEIKSSSIIILGHIGAQGYIALGSKDQERFKHTMGTLFLDYVADVVNEKLNQLMQ